MIKCPICGEELEIDAKYCSGCGNPVQKIGSRQHPTTLECTCKNCGGTMNYEPDQSVLLCPFCGAKQIVIEDEDITIARIRSEAYKEVELKKIEQKAKEKKRKNPGFQGSKKIKALLSVFLLFMTAICAILGLGATAAGDTLYGVIASIQAVLFFLSWLLMMQLIRRPAIRFTWPMTAALILIIPFMIALMTIGTGPYRNVAPDSPYEWPVGSIADVIPQPDGEYGTIYYESEETLNMDVSMGSISDFRSYVNECKEAGYTVDVSSGNNSFAAYNEEGYHLDLYYYESENYMSLTADAPIKMGKLYWPTSEIAKTLPLPESDYGLISWENSSGFDIYVGNTTEEDFDAYCKACMEAGYSEDYYKGKGYLNAHDENDNSLSIYYEGNKTMRIHLYAAD